MTSENSPRSVPQRARQITIPQLSGRPRKFVRATHIAVSARMAGSHRRDAHPGHQRRNRPRPDVRPGLLRDDGTHRRRGHPAFAVATLVTGIVL